MDMPKVMLRFSCGSEEGVVLPREPVLGDTIELRKEEYIVSKVLLGEKGKFIAMINDELKSPKPPLSTAL
jgi:hypothetical protein